MGIYISGVKGLPEQVQENKEKIANIEEDIRDIDWDAIHNLENQVAENTQDINNMEGTIGTQNIAITNLGGRVDDLETKTSEITKSATATNISGTTTLYNVVVGANLATQGDIEVNRSIVMSYDEGSKMELDVNSTTYYGFNDDEQVEIHSLGDVYKFTSTGITLNDNPLGTTLYQHNMHLESGNADHIGIVVINDSSTPFTYSSLANFLYNNGFNNYANGYTNVSGVCSSNDNNLMVVSCLTHNTPNNFYARGIDLTTGVMGFKLTTSWLLTDKVIQIA